MPLSLTERERRYDLVRQGMKKQDLDVLVIIGRDGSNLRGNHRYISGYGVAAPLDHYIVFPKEAAEPVFLSSSAAMKTPHTQGWVNDTRGLHDPEKQILDEVRPFNQAGRIGLVQMSTIPIPVYLNLIKEFGDEAVCDATDIFREIRLIKSDEEIECLRKAAKVADDVYLYLKSNIYPGWTDWEIFGQIRRIIHEGHCQYSMDVIDCAEQNHMYAPIGNILAEHGKLSVEITPAYEGYHAQLLVDIPILPDSRLNQRLLDVLEKGYNTAIAALRPGSKASDLYWAATNVIKNEGFEMAAGRVGHGLGLDVDEYFPLGPNDNYPIKAGMIFAIHPMARQEDGYKAWMGGTFLVTNDGSEPLYKVKLF